MNWWSTATQEQRLAQIDGAIECRMTSWQLAMNLRFEDYVSASKGIRIYAAKHGRNFIRDTSAGLKTSANVGRAMSTRRRLKNPETNDRSAFDIFPRKPAKTNLFERIPYETEEA